MKAIVDSPGREAIIKRNGYIAGFFAGKKSWGSGVIVV
jgi:hypothetical protein